MSSVGKEFLETAIRRSSYYRELGDKTFVQVEEDGFFFQPNASSNSIAIIIQHMVGNMLSRWTNFLTEDGEKEWRRRDEEFETIKRTKAELIELWNKGWDCYISALQQLGETDLLKTVYIRSESLSVIDAINRQLAHYPYHVGQIVYLGRLIADTKWKSLSIPRGQSVAFNKDMGHK
jgi:Protein of unknown function (DUF1572)